MTAGRRRGLCAPGPRLPGTALSVADSAVDAAAAAALRARIAAAFERSEHACAEEDGSARAQAYHQIGKRLLRGTMGYHVHVRLRGCLRR